MRCEIAKRNPLLMKMASDFYRNHNKGKDTSEFTFKSLYADDEPYPLHELIIVMNERVRELEAVYDETKQETDFLLYAVANAQLGELLKATKKRVRQDQD